MAVAAPTRPAKERKPKADLRPFTLRHFCRWASDLVLDSGEKWVPEPFQEAFLADVFAGVPECWLVVPEGNGKTTLVAGLALYVCEFSDGIVEIPVAASSREQAGLIYRQAEGFVLRSPRLHEVVPSAIRAIKGKLKLVEPRFTPLEGYRRINHVSGSRIQVFAADDRTGDGVIFRLGILDELHRHRDLSLYRTWAGKRTKVGGQLIAISTAGEPGEEFEQTRENIRQRADEMERKGCFLRAASPELVLHEWAVPEDGDVEDLALVAAANPFSGVTETVLASKRRSPTMTLAHWRRFTCNLPTRSESAAIGEAEWESAKGGEIPEGTPIWLGLDVAWKWDTTAAVPFWWKSSEERILGLSRVLIPPRDGTSLDPNLVEKMLLEIHARNPVHTVVMDTNKAEFVGEWIKQNLGAEVIDRQQTNALAAEDYERLTEALRNGWLKHSGDADLTQHVLNAVARILPDGRAKFERPTASRFGPQDRRVIDALVAASMVHTAASTAGAYDLLESVY